MTLLIGDAELIGSNHIAATQPELSYYDLLQSLTVYFGCEYESVPCVTFRMATNYVDKFTQSFLANKFMFDLTRKTPNILKDSLSDISVISCDNIQISK